MLSWKKWQRCGLAWLLASPAMALPGGQQAAPLENLLEIIRQNCVDCRILKMELEDDDGGLVYEVKLLTPDGQVIKQEYQATDLRLLRQKGGRSHRR